MASTPETALPEEHADPHAHLILYGGRLQVLWHMAWPAIAVMMAFGLNAVMDAVYIGRLIGEQALAGAVLAYPLTQLTLGLGSLAGAAVLGLLARAIVRR